MQSTRSTPCEAATASSTGVSGLKATPTPRPCAHAPPLTSGSGSAATSTWNVTLSPPASAICGMCRAPGSSTMRWQSRTPPRAWTIGAIACSTTGPIVIGSTKCPSPTSKWKIRAPALRSSLHLLAEAREVGRVERRLDLEPSGPVLPGHARILAMKNPDVPWTCGSVSRNSGRRGWRKPGHSAPRSSGSRPAASTTSSFSAAIDRADRVRDRAPGTHALGRDGEQRALELRQRLAAPAQVRTRRRARRARSTARRRARGRTP